MSQGHRASPQVHLVVWDFTNFAFDTNSFLAEGVAVHGDEVRQNLPGKSLVDLKNVDVSQGQTGLLQQFGRGERRPEKQFLHGISRGKQYVSQVGLRLETKFLGLRLSGNEAGGGSVRQEGCVGCSYSSVLGEGGPQFPELLHG